MYEDFYGFHEKPFNLTPDPSFLYLSEKHKEAFAHLLYGIRNRCGFIMVSGEIGTGKTTICRSLLGKLDDNIEIAFIFNPILSAVELLRAVIQDFGIDSEADSVKGLIDELNAYLLKSAAEGRNCVLVIDEAQNLDPKVLEQIRLLSNLETETQKLLQIVLIGQPELHQVLATRELRQLNQRITARYHLKELDRDETLHYIAFRLRVAGGRRKVRFTQPAVKRIYRYTNGTPRVINAVCDRALLIGYTKETRVITPAIVKQAIHELRGEAVRDSQPGRRGVAPAMRLMATGAMGLLIAGLAALLLPELRRAFPGPSAEPMASDPVTQPRIAEAAPIVELVETESVFEPAELPNTDEVVEPQAAALEPIESADELRAAIASRSVNEMHRAAVKGLFEAWNHVPESDVPPPGYDASFAAYVRGEGFSYMPRNATLEHVRAVNLPVYAYLEGDDLQRPVAILRVTEETYTLRFAQQGPVEVGRDAVEALFANDVVYLWIDPQPGKDNVLPWHRGPEVTELQQKLQELELLAAAPTGAFDRPTLNAVREIQRATGLDVDGVVGVQTRMVLTSWDRSIDTPQLDADATLEQFAMTRAPEPKPAPSLPEVEVNAAPVPPPARPIIREKRTPETVADRVSAQARPTEGPIDQTVTARPRVAVEELGQPEYNPLLERPDTRALKRVTEPAAEAVPLVPRQADEE